MRILSQYINMAIVLQYDCKKLQFWYNLGVFEVKNKGKEMEE